MESKSIDQLKKLQKQIDAIRKKSSDTRFHYDTDNLDVDDMEYTNENSN